ncbi:HAD-IA family hydrolase [Butyrivibrio sp. AC2005]|uniref:HAD-IA family hydrolase n=1 Tax=Butyrivibrio sp. AC2005 TaxID=1280672 RepID=UPI000417154D|nr:HAD-IA family hydrolase [Butyrivibrio sp. AC2005]
MILKKIIKRVVKNLFGREVCDFPLAVIAWADVISFDMYDTLIFRSCGDANAVFKEVEKQWNNIHNQYISGFALKRAVAEKKAKKSCKREINLKDIYNEIDGYRITELEELYDYEIKKEIDTAELNNEMYELYKKCIETGKKIVIMSDMYMPKVVLETILRNHGIVDYDEIFVSGDVGESKQSGKLYKKVLSEQIGSYGNILHIGDNVYSDFLMARIMGIKAILYSRKL